MRARLCELCGVPAPVRFGRPDHLRKPHERCSCGWVGLRHRQHQTLMVTRDPCHGHAFVGRVPGPLN